MDLAVSMQFKYDFKTHPPSMFPLIYTTIERKGRTKEIKAGKTPLIIKIMSKLIDSHL